MAFSCPHPNLLRGIVQGSGLDHMLYIIMEGDLKALSDSNLLFKYADDTNHLVPEISDVDINDELNNVLKWAADNRMIVNIHKTQEIVFHRPSARYSLPSLVTGIEQVVTYLQSCPELLFLTILNLMSLLRIFSQSAINVVICLSVWRAKAFPLKNSILSSVPWLSRAFCMPCQLGAVFWLLTWLAKLMVICVKPFEGLYCQS